MPMKTALESKRVAVVTRGPLWSSAKIAALALCLVIVAVPAFAWNDEGHMAIAYLAYQRLQPATRARVNALLKLNPHYSKWRAALPAGISEADADRMIFMIAATWPDQLRTDPAYMDDGPNHGNSPPSGPKAARNIGYADHLRHKYWHFIDIPYTQDGTRLPPTPAPNAETQIAAFRRALNSNASDGVKSYDLSWLEHLVGDIHQPLHAITRVIKSMPDGTPAAAWICCVHRPVAIRCIGFGTGSSAAKTESKIPVVIRTWQPRCAPPSARHKHCLRPIRRRQRKCRSVLGCRKVLISPSNMFTSVPWDRALARSRSTRSITPPPNAWLNSAWPSRACAWETC